MICFGQASLQYAIGQFMTHYESERNHQELENRPLQPHPATGPPQHPIQLRQRLGGMLNYYHLAAAA